MILQTAGNIAAAMPEKWQNNGTADNYARYSSRYPR
jgi:hypothetical protein